MTCLFRGPGKKGNCVCSKFVALDQQESFMIFLASTVFPTICRFLRRHCPKVTDFVSPLRADKICLRKGVQHWVETILPAQAANQNTVFTASDI